MQTVTEPCFFCHKTQHWHGAIATVRVENGLESYGHRVAHCGTRIQRKHPNGQTLSTDKGYYLWIENPEKERANRKRLKSYASYVGEPEYWYAETVAA